MSTVNGFGFSRYGWKALPDGTAVATCWLVAAFFPVIPLRRERIRIYPATGNAGFYIPFVAATGFHTNMEIIERLPLDFGNVFATYFKGYVVAPAVLLVPFIVMIYALNWLFRSAPHLPVYILLLELLGSIIYCSVVVAYILDGAAGRRAVKYTLSPTFEVSCTHCNYRFAVPVEDAGKPIICLSCVKKFTAPNAEQ